MNFLALLLGLAVERVLTHLFHLREFRWLDGLFDAQLRRLGRAGYWFAIGSTAALAVLLVAPVAIVSLSLWDEFLQIPYFLFAVVVLLFSLGPRDLDEEVEEYADALESGNEEGQRALADELLEQPAPEGVAGRNEAVERALYVQANNRMFGVIFWFLLLGPTGAWAFRVLDLIRHRSRRHAGSGGEQGIDAGGQAEAAVRTLHGIMAWPSARLLAAGYMLAGNFEEAVTAWRVSGQEFLLRFYETTEEVLARVGIAASGRASLDVTDSTEALARIRAARALILRTLWMIWCPIIAVLTLYDWLT
jgi:membrane protein required for beta-lactamase induction